MDGATHGDFGQMFYAASLMLWVICAAFKRGNASAAQCPEDTGCVLNDFRLMKWQMITRSRGITHRRAHLAAPTVSVHSGARNIPPVPRALSHENHSTHALCRRITV
jgi:hypothetical protein